MKDFVTSLRKIYPISDEGVQWLLEGCQEISFRKGERILKEGQRIDQVYFVKEGFARVYVLREEKDLTLWFTAPGEMLTGSPALKSFLNAEVLEDSVILKMPARYLESLFNRSLELANWGRKLAEHYLTEYEHYFTHYSGRDARAQYERLLREYPDLIQKSPLKHIASYLQITPQSLSRIRAKK